MAQVAAITAIVGAGIGVVSKFRSGLAEKRVAEKNAAKAKREEERQAFLNKLEQDRHWKQATKIIGKQTSAAVSSGVAASSGSVEAVERSSIQEALLDSEIIKMGGDAKIRDLSFQAEIFARRARSIDTANKIQAGAGLLATAAKAADTFNTGD